MLKITIKNKDTHQVHITDKERIHIGRSLSCDFIINKKEISRKHLEITQKNGKIFIQDVSLNNWILHDDDKLSKTSSTEYHLGEELELPERTLFTIEHCYDEIKLEPKDIYLNKSYESFYMKKKLTKEAEYKTRKSLEISFIWIVAFIVFMFNLVSL